MIAILFAGFFLDGCATSPDGTSEANDEFIGQPPSPDDDPFSVRGDVRSEAVEATPEGEIREEDFEEPTPRDDLEANPDEWDEALGGADSRGEASTDETVRCFSCVKICPIDGDCASSKQDLICGWGTHSSREKAAARARAECDATLDMARQMPVWSRIEGRCPPSTCRQ